MPEKEYKITYKTFYNKRLKKRYFHRRLMYPLYIQVIFDRIPITFKSYYFDLYSKPKFAVPATGALFIPDIQQIVRKEKALMDFIINKNLKSFSLDLFKKDYAFYSRDLPNTMEEGFSNYLYTFFHDEGLPFIANLVKKDSHVIVLYRLVQDLKKALATRLYKKLIDNSFYYAPPYLTLYAFAEEYNSDPHVSLTVMEWEQPETKEKFIKFFKMHYRGHDVNDTLAKIQQFLIQ